MNIFPQRGETRNSPNQELTLFARTGQSMATPPGNFQDMNSLLDHRPLDRIIAADRRDASSTNISQRSSVEGLPGTYPMTVNITPGDSDVNVASSNGNVLQGAGDQSMDEDARLPPTTNGRLDMVHDERSRPRSPSTSSEPEPIAYQSTVDLPQAECEQESWSLESEVTNPLMQPPSHPTSTTARKTSKCQTLLLIMKLWGPNPLGPEKAPRCLKHLGKLPKDLSQKSTHGWKFVASVQKMDGWLEVVEAFNKTPSCRVRVSLPIPLQTIATGSRHRTSLL
jgi:hypothetical protein